METTTVEQQMKDLTNTLMHLVGIDYAGVLTSTQLKLGLDGLQAIVKCLQDLDKHNYTLLVEKYGEHTADYWR